MSVVVKFSEDKRKKEAVFVFLHISPASLVCPRDKYVWLGAPALVLPSSATPRTS